MKNPLLFSRLFNTPLMIQPLKLDAIVAGLGGRFGLPDSLPAPSAYLANAAKPIAPGYQINGRVAVVDIFGVLTHRGMLEGASSYIVGYDHYAKLINAAIADPQIRGILLQLDTPGGEVSGAFELATQIKAAAAVKPIKAVISSMAASAGYLLASAAGDIAISETGHAGSIGVVMRHIDMSKAAEQDGISVTYIYAGDRKVDGNPFQPLPASVKADLQAQIDKLYSLFVTTVSNNRGLSADTIRRQQAAVYTGQDAIDAGLADRIATPDEVLAEMQFLIKSGRSIEMTTNAEAIKLAERQRIKAILTSTAAMTRHQQARTLAYDSNLSADEAIKLLAATSEPGYSYTPSSITPPTTPPAANQAKSEADMTDAELAAKVVTVWNQCRVK